jgi:hypothetical protein
MEGSQRKMEILTALKKKINSYIWELTVLDTRDSLAHVRRNIT